MRTSIGVEVPSDAKGCLQDVHWGAGALGYFPSYTLGAIIASQLYARLVEEVPDIEDQIRRGEFANVLAWLRANIHRRGCLYGSPDELVRVVTGRGIDAQVYIDYLRKKYAALYNIQESELSL